MESQFQEGEVMSEAKVLNSIRLTSDSYQKLNEMLDALMKADSEAKVTLSKLLSFIVLDYSQKYFDRSLEKITSLYRDKKKDAAKKIESMSEEQLASVIKFLEKMETGQTKRQEAAHG